MLLLIHNSSQNSLIKVVCTLLLGMGSVPSLYFQSGIATVVRGDHAVSGGILDRGRRGKESSGRSFYETVSGFDVYVCVCLKFVFLFRSLSFISSENFLLQDGWFWWNGGNGCGDGPGGTGADDADDAGDASAGFLEDVQ